MMNDRNKEFRSNNLLRKSYFVLRISYLVLRISYLFNSHKTIKNEKDNQV